MIISIHAQYYYSIDIHHVTYTCTLCGMCILMCDVCISVCINVCLGEWITPTVTGDRPPPISHFTLTSVSNNTALLFGGVITNGRSDKVYVISCIKTSVVS